jgi:hypothetical protein
MKKVTDPHFAQRFDQIPNIGSAMSDDFKLLGLKRPQDLAKKDPYDLYVKLCQKTASYHDPCVLDTFIAATRFMSGIENKSWWAYTDERKKNWDRVAKKVEKFKTP